MEIGATGDLWRLRWGTELKTFASLDPVYRALQAAGEQAEALFRLETISAAVGDLLRARTHDTAEFLADRATIPCILANASRHQSGSDLARYGDLLLQALKAYCDRRSIDLTVDLGTPLPDFALERNWVEAASEIVVVLGGETAGVGWLDLFIDVPADLHVLVVEGFPRLREYLTQIVREQLALRSGAFAITQLTPQPAKNLPALVRIGTGQARSHLARLCQHVQRPGGGVTYHVESSYDRLLAARARLDTVFRSTLSYDNLIGAGLLVEIGGDSSAKVAQLRKHWTGIVYSEAVTAWWSGQAAAFAVTGSPSRPQ